MTSKNPVVQNALNAKAFAAEHNAVKNWNYKNNYQFFCVVPSMTKPCILSGWDYKADAQDDAKELKEVGIAHKIVSRRFLEQKGIDPNDAASWKKNNLINKEGNASMIKSTNSAVQKAINGGLDKSNGAAHFKDYASKARDVINAIKNNAEDELRALAGYAEKMADMAKASGDLKWHSQILRSQDILEDALRNYVRGSLLAIKG